MNSSQNSKNNSKTVLLVGGGTGGHIFPLFNLAKNLIEKNQNTHLIVNQAPLDQSIIKENFSQLQKKGLHVHFLKTQKLDYHLSLRNLLAPFQILNSFIRTRKLIKKIKPDIVFFKGGFVGFPILISLKYLVKFRGKIYLHESDISAGKLTQFIGKSADQIFSNFGQNPMPLFYWPKDEKIIKKKNSKPQILIFGGSQGAQFLNNIIIQKKEELLEKYKLTLITGPKNKIQKSNHKNFEILNFCPQKELIKKIVDSDLVICRSGASMFQVLAAQTACIAIPLPTSARNHQYENAKYFAENGLCALLEQNAQTKDLLLSKIQETIEDEKLKLNLKKASFVPQDESIAQILIS